MTPLRDLMTPPDRDMWAATLRQAVEDLGRAGAAFDDAVLWFEEHPELAASLCVVTGTPPAALYTYVNRKCKERGHPNIRVSHILAVFRNGK